MLKIFIIPIVLFCFAAPALTSEANIDNESLLNAVEALQLEIRNDVKKRLQLSEHEEQRFWPVYDKFEAEMGVIFKKLIGLSYLMMNDQQSMSEDEADKVIDEMIDTQKRSFSIQLDYAEKFRNILPPGKILIFLNILFSS